VALLDVENLVRAVGGVPGGLSFRSGTVFCFYCCKFVVVFLIKIDGGFDPLGQKQNLTLD
jgi:hypothetical protein